jgi:hypothetical protein
MFRWLSLYDKMSAPFVMALISPYSLEFFISATQCYKLSFYSYQLNPRSEGEGCP